MPTPPADNLPVHVPLKEIRQFERNRERQSNKEILRKLKRYLLMLEDGELHHAACRAAGLTPGTLQGYRRDNQQFAEAEKIARAEGVEKIEQKLKDEAMKGNLSAIDIFLKANDEKYAPKRADTHNSVIIVPITSANVLERIQLLKEELERRDRDIPGIFRDTNPFLNGDLTPAHADDVVVDAEVIDDA